MRDSEEVHSLCRDCPKGLRNIGEALKEWNIQIEIDRLGGAPDFSKFVDKISAPLKDIKNLSFESRKNSKKLTMNLLRNPS